MAQLLINVGARSVDAVRSAADRMLADAEYTIEILPTIRRAQLDYAPAVGDVDSNYAALTQGTVCSLRLRPDTPKIAWVLIFAPAFGEKRPAPWTAVAELRDPAYRPLFEMLLEIPGLDFVVASIEETLDLEPHHVDVKSFPWADWHLLRAAVMESRSTEKQWVIRDGPARI